ncbi:MAG: serine/threonine protein kinase [Planctomycetes bacterium]|nr:serine/threonine protein kinase [Planctomycetota bacterium]
MPDLRLPLPIARLRRRSQNAKSAMEEHHTAFHAWEVSLKLAVVLHHPDALRQLARASLGDWVRAFELGDRPLGSPALLELDAWLRDKGDAPERKLLARTFFANLVAYRNRVIGHGSTREMEFYARGAILLREGLSAAWEAELFAPAGSELLYVGAVVGSERRGAPAELLRLQGEEIEAVDPRGETTPADLWAHHPYARHAAVWSDLHPWLLFDEEREQLYCFNKFARRAQYLDYASGLFLEGAPLEELRPGLEGELRELFRGATAVTAEPEAPRLAEGRTSFGDFELERLLGQGAMGEVHLAQQRSLGRRVALKLLSTSLERDPVALARFRREVEALSRCEHPNVVKILAHGTTQGRPWYAMEYVEGADLVEVGKQLAETRDFAAAVSRACRPSAEPPPAASRRKRFQELARFFAEAARGVQHLHDRGIVHRDLKPSNLMVTAHGHRAVVMDLGLAVVENRSLALTKDRARPLGTLRYMPPEQLERRRADLTPRADVYALGATLYELATGHAFRDGESEEALLHQILHVDPRPARELARELPVDLELILRKATEREVALRYESAASFASDLDAFAEGRAVSARPQSFAYLLLVALRRYQRLATAAILVTLVGAAIYAVQMRSAGRKIKAESEDLSDSPRVSPVALRLSPDSERTIQALVDQIASKWDEWVGTDLPKVRLSVYPRRGSEDDRETEQVIHAMESAIFSAARWRLFSWKMIAPILSSLGIEGSDLVLPENRRKVNSALEMQGFVLECLMIFDLIPIGGILQADDSRNYRLQIGIYDVVTFDSSFMATGEIEFAPK